MMEIVYLPANGAWVIRFGDRIIGIGIYNQFIFCSRKELRETLKKCGLQIKNNKIIDVV